MNRRPSWLRLLATAALVAAFALTACGGLGQSLEDGGVASQCELNPPREMAALERCLALNPRDVELMLDLGALHETDGRADRAEALYRLALSVDSRDGDLHVRLGRLLLERGDAAGAAAEARTALARQPQSSRALDLLGYAEKAGAR